MATDDDRRIREIESATYVQECASAAEQIARSYPEYDDLDDEERGFIRFGAACAIRAMVEHREFIRRLAQGYDAREAEAD